MRNIFVELDYLCEFFVESDYLCKIFLSSWIICAGFLSRLITGISAKRLWSLIIFAT